MMPHTPTVTDLASIQPVSTREDDSDTAAVATAKAGEVNGRRRRALALSRAGPNRGAVVSGSGSGSGSSSAQRAATTAVHLLGAGAACIWILLACNEHHARLIGCRSQTAGQGGTWCIVRNDHGAESRREATSTSPSSSPDAANACLSCLPFAPPLTESSARHREDQHTHAAASGRPVRNATQRSQRARACRRTLRSGGTRVVQLLPTDPPSSNNFDSNPGRAVVRRMEWEWEARAVRRRRRRPVRGPGTAHLRKAGSLL